MSVVGTVTKDNAETARLVADLSDWLDPGEVIGSISNFSLQQVSAPLATAWQVDYPFATTNTSATLTDTYPLTLSGAVIVNSQQASILVQAGTPGLDYIVSCLVTGSTSGREKQVDFYVSVNELVNPNMISSSVPQQSLTITVVGSTTALAAGTTGKVFVENHTGAQITITLPPQPANGATLDAVDSSGNAATNNIIWVGSGGVQINGASSYSFTNNYQSASFTWNGTEWIAV